MIHTRARTRTNTHRFEMPDPAWCKGCGRHINRGTRFNAKKEQDGAYYSTKIWAFFMKCPTCPQRFIIKTDPKNRDYEFVEGIKKQDKSYDPEEVGVELLPDEERAKKAITADAMDKLQHDKEGKLRAAAKRSRLENLLDWSNSAHMDDYDLNASLRSVMRGKRKRKLELEEEAASKGLGIRLLELSPSDVQAAKASGAGTVARHAAFGKEAARFLQIKAESVMCSKEKGPKSGKLRDRVMSAAAARGRIGPNVAKRLRGKPVASTKMPATSSVRVKQKGLSSLNSITVNYRND